MSKCSVVLIGCTGTGKSTVGNKLLRQTTFRVSDGWTQLTTTASKGQRQLGATTLEVLDTPDLVNLEPSKEELELERAKWQQLTPSPDAVLVTVRCDTRYVREDYEAADKHLRVVPGVSTDSVIIVFTHGERLQQADVADWIKHAGKYLQAICEECEYRSIVVSAGDDGVDHVPALLALITRIQAGRARRRRTNGFLVVWNLFCFVVLYFRRAANDAAALRTITQSDIFWITAAAILPTLFFKFPQIRNVCWKYYMKVMTMVRFSLLPRIRPTN